MSKDGVVLLIVVDDEKPEDKGTSKYTAADLSGEVEIPQRTRQIGQQ